MAKKRTTQSAKKAAKVESAPDVLEAMTEDPIAIEAQPEPVKRYEAPVAGGLVKVRNISSAVCNGIAPGAVGELRADHPALNPLALELEIVG